MSVILLMSRPLHNVLPRAGDTGQRRSHDFCLGGPPGRCHSPGTFSVISGSRPDSVGGGVVAQIIPTTFAGGGGSGRDFVPVAAGKDQSNSLNSGNLFYISDSKNVTTTIHSTKKTFTKSVGGQWPRAPPPWLRH